MHKYKRPETPLNYIYEYVNRESSMEDRTFIAGTLTCTRIHFF